VDFEGAVTRPVVIKDAFATWKAEIAKADEWLDALAEADLGREETGPDPAATRARRLDAQLPAGGGPDLLAVRLVLARRGMPAPRRSLRAALRGGVSVQPAGRHPTRRLWPARNTTPRNGVANWDDRSYR
jgi:hypothetical protein